MGSIINDTSKSDTSSSETRYVYIVKIGSTVFAQPTAERPYRLLYSGPPSLRPQNCPFPWVDLDRIFIRDSLGPSEPTAQTASLSIQPFLVTDRPTDRPRYSVCNNRPHLRTQYCDAA